MRITRLLAGLIGLVGFVLLAGCTTLSNLQNAYDTATGATVPFSLVQTAIGSYVAIEKTAKNYVVFCTPDPQPAGCNDNIIQHQIDPAIRSGRASADALLTFYDEHSGALGPKGLYDALVSATSTLQSIQTIYGVAKK